jgi:biotin carboxyl carrier protein
VSVERVEALLRLLQRQLYVTEMEVEGEGWRVRARRGSGYALPALQEETPEEPAVEESPTLAVLAHRVGFFRAPARPLRPGDEVQEGAVVGQIDSIGILNPVVAGASGYVVESRVEDGDPVEYGQQLLLLSPEPPAAT